MRLSRRISRLLPRRPRPPCADGSVHPLPYAIPSELVVRALPDKVRVWSEVVPGVPDTYRYGAGEEAAYLSQYGESRFAHTWRKGGWECLRHYEILANGCVPIVRNLEAVPDRTLTAFPKELAARAAAELLPWSDDKEDAYRSIAKAMLSWTRERLTCEAMTLRFLDRLGLRPTREDGAPTRVLLLRCHPGVNYSREMLAIGLKRVVECVEHPRIDYLYDDFPAERLATLVGNGFCYARRLPTGRSEAWSSDRVRASIRERFWDVVVYGKMGADERRAGSVPGCPFWRDVSRAYGPDRIAFLYGGDAPQLLSSGAGAHSAHLRRHCSLGQCFVRELAD